MAKGRSIAILALVYFIAAKLGLRLAVVHPYATAVWPPSGIALAALLTYGRGLWPGVALGALLANLTTGASLSTAGALASAGIAIGNTLEALVGAYLVERFAGGMRAFDRTSDVFRFAALAALGSTLASAGAGVISLCLAGLAQWADAGTIGATWWIGNAAGDLIIAPAALLWLQNARLPWTRNQYLEAAMAVLAAIFFALLSFTSVIVPHAPGLGLAFLCTPPLLWAAFRFGRRESASLLLLVYGIAIWASMRGMISGEVAPAYVPLELQAYMGVTSITLLAVAAEVFERLRQRATLAESERELRLVTDDAPVFLAHYDQKVRFRFVNRAYADRFGVQPEQLTGKHISEVVGYQAFQLLRPFIDATLSGRRLEYEIEIPYESLGKRFMRCAYVPVNDISGAPDGFVAVLTDITEQKATETKLQHEYALRQAIESSMPTGVAVVDSDGKQTYVNDAFCRMVDYSREELVGATAPFVYWPPEEAGAIAEALRLTLMGGAPGEGFTVQFQRRGGERFEALLMISAVRLAEDEPNGWLACVSDISEHMRLHEEVKRQEEQLRLVIDGMPGLVAYIDRGLQYRFVNRGYAEWFALPRHSIEGRQVSEVLGNHWVDAIEEHLATAFAGSPVTFERALDYPEGARTVRATYVPDRAADGTVRGIVVLIQDITAQAKALRALQESEERFRRIVETASEGIWIIDPAGITTFANKRMCELLGCSQEEMLGHPCFDYLHPDDRQRGLDGIEGRRQGSTRSTEYRACRKDGAIIWLQFTGAPIHDESGKLTGVLAMCTDVTERKYNEARYQTLFSASQDGILIVNGEGFYVDVNQSLCDLLKTTREALIGSPFAPFIPPERLAEAEAAFQTLASTGHFEGEFPLRAADGTIVELEWRSVANFVPGLHCCVARDVRERNRFQEQMRQTQKLESLGVLAGGIAHDFNNLLVGILGNASLALDVLGNNPAQTMLHDVVSAGERAAKLTRQLLAYAGKQQLSTAVTDVNSLLSEITPLLRASIPKTVHLNLELQDGLPCVEADPVQLQQVVMNMVINGAEAISDGMPGSVTVSTSLRRLTEQDRAHSVIPIPAGDQQYALLSFIDTGSGMTPEVQSRIFDPFFTTKFAGRGLGLSAVLGIVRSHHGALTLESGPGEGTTFRVLLPTTKAPLAAEDAERSAAPVPGKGTVLVVDDEQIVRTVARRALERSGYSVLTANDGLQAIEMLRAHPEIVAVLLDLAMPVMTGDQAAPHLRQQRPDLPIILSSGYPEGEATRRFSQYGVTAFLQKPYTARGLADKIAGVLQ